MVCTTCYSQHKPIRQPAGSAVVELALYLFTWPLFWIPALFYSHWRSKNAVNVCRFCRGAMIEVDSPRGKQILSNAYPEVNNTRLASVH